MRYHLNHSYIVIVSAVLTRYLNGWKYGAMSVSPYNKRSILETRLEYSSTLEFLCYIFIRAIKF